MAGGTGRVVLVADDDQTLRMLCRVNLEFEGYRVLEAASAEEIRGVLESDDVHVVLLDIQLGADDGVAVAKELRGSHPGLPIVFFSGSASAVEIANASAGLADGVLPKPFSLEELSETVRRLARE